MPHRRLETSARRRVLECVEAELVQQRRHRDMRIVRHHVPQRERAIGRQLAHQPIRKRLEGIVLVLLGFGLAADRDDGALDRGRGRFAAWSCVAAAFGLAIGTRGCWRLVFGPDVAAIDR
jgi:hypothetical protein